VKSPRAGTGRALRSACAALFVLAAAQAVHAALFDDAEARKRIEATNQRMAQVQKQLDERISVLETQLKNQGLIELFKEVEQMKADTAKLRGQIEVLNHEMEQTQKRQRDLYVDLDSRLRKIESGPGAGVAPADAAAAPAATGAPPMTPAPSPAPPGVTGTIGGRSGTTAADTVTEQRAYDVALDQFKGANYGAAIAGFAAFVRTYPKSPLAPSAQYWIGNAQFAQKDFRTAIASQRQLIATYPDSPKIPDAMLNIATCQFELGEAPASRRTLEDLIAKHPQSDAAAKARQRLATR
jgi:tol-pal system protein YbgF